VTQMGSCDALLRLVTINAGLQAAATHRHSDGSRGGSDFADFPIQGSAFGFRFESDSSGNA
jgi:hypothetical protein